MKRWGLYDLSKSPPGWDFLLYLQLALPAGVNAIAFGRGFNGDHGTIDDEKRKFAKIAVPLCEAYGLDWELTTGHCTHDIHFPDGKWKRKPHSVYYLKHIDGPTPLMPSKEVLDRVNDRLGGRKRIVVILRESPIEPLRNSGPDWRRWASDHNAVVLEDGQKSDMRPEEYAAYMDLASVTVMVSGGPVSLAYCSTHRPYLALKPLCYAYKAATPMWWSRQEWEIGDQMPWAGKHQKIVWGTEDDYQTIENEYQQYLKEQS